MFQITEDDLAAMEHDLSELFQCLWHPGMTNKQKVQMRRVQESLSRVRFHYGPPMEIERLDEESRDGEAV